MDGSLIVVFLLVSYAAYTVLWPQKTDYSKVPKQYYTSYREYLQSDSWKELRKMRAFIDSDQCIRCGSTHSLQCHHTDYSGIETMTFFLSQLETVCEECHSKIHKGQLPMKHTPKVSKSS